MSITVDDVRDYDKSLTGHTDTAIQGAIDAEAAAQAGKCRIPDPVPADLDEALLRRVVCNLARRKLPLAMLQGDADGGAARLPGNDPEVRRLEAPHRKLVSG
jgi:hypothetical protein